MKRETETVRERKKSETKTDRERYIESQTENMLNAEYLLLSEVMLESFNGFFANLNNAKGT